jgi:leucyl-tRNA synthetase
MIEYKSSWSEYRPQEIEPKWQRFWETNQLYRARSTGDKEKYYCLEFFPYPSGEGLHVGHCRNYVPTDLISRYKRMRGLNVLHPMGWDAFGEPTEQAAIASGLNPRETTDRNTANFKRQLKMIGTGYDWEREIDSSLPEYYHWTQYFFLLLYRRGLAYRDTNWQWWCPVCQTTLSSHEVTDGICWRGHVGVTKREIPAWYFKITAYADRLLNGLSEIDWPEPIKLQQRNWIGKSEGCEINFFTENGEKIPVFTTRPDTLFGVTFLVVAPEHAILSQITAESHREQVEAYRELTIRQSEIDRMVETREKTGVATGGFVIHPLTGEKVPVWVADYVLPGYGTGAVMAVPAHDQRDYEFAKKYHLPIRVVIAPPGYTGEELGEAWTEPGTLINSAEFNDLASQIGAQAISDALAERGLGGSKTTYRMRDWLISRQRYWGTPIPIVYCDDCGEVPVPEDQLPVSLPPMENFRPDGSGRSPLARVTDFVHTRCPICDQPARRETDTMGGFACSSWYFLRFASPRYAQAPFDPIETQYWLPVDLYVGGAEHAVLHLLYARFWTQVMYDAGLIQFQEPFPRLMNQGQLLAPDGSRMSKSRRNIITPDSIVIREGADALRIYGLFMAPFDQDVAWSTDGLVGAQRFIQKIWSLFQQCYLESALHTDEDSALECRIHQTIQNVTWRIDHFRFNTMISTLMEFVNHLVEVHRSNSWKSVTFHRALNTLILLLAPAAPHLSEELWSLTGHTGSVHTQTWPDWDPSKIEEETVQIPVQINGKLRAVLDIDSSMDEEDIKRIVINHEKIKPYVNRMLISRIIYIPGKAMSIVGK